MTGASAITTAEDAYRVYVRHTYVCSACVAGRACPTAARLGRAWRETRR